MSQPDTTADREVGNAPARQPVERLLLRRLKYAAWRTARACSTSSRAAPEDVAILYLFAEKNRYPQTRAFIEDYRRWLGGSRVRMVCIDNKAAPADPRQVADGLWEMPGDNRQWEFSGWKKATAFLQSLENPPALVLYVNDACLNYRSHGWDETFFRMRFDDRSIARADRALLGMVNRAPSKHVLFGRDVSTWVKTNFFCLPLSLAQSLPWTFLDDATLARLLPAAYDGTIVNPTDDMNEDLRLFLTRWMTELWHRSTPASAETWPFLRQKLIAILNERMLTSHLRENGHTVIDAEPLLWR